MVGVSRGAQGGCMDVGWPEVGRVSRDGSNSKGGHVVIEEDVQQLQRLPADGGGDVRGHVENAREEAPEEAAESVELRREEPGLRWRGGGEGRQSRFGGFGAEWRVRRPASTCSEESVL